MFISTLRIAAHRITTDSCHPEQSEGSDFFNSHKNQVSELRLPLEENNPIKPHLILRSVLITGTSLFFLENSAIDLFPNLTPKRTGFPALSTRSTLPKRSPNKIQPSFWTATLSPLHKKRSPTIFTARWANTRLSEGRIKMRISPILIDFVSTGDMKILSPDRINGFMLLPGANKLIACPLSMAARIKSANSSESTKCSEIGTGRLELIYLGSVLGYLPARIRAISRSPNTT